MLIILRKEIMMLFLLWMIQLILNIRRKDDKFPIEMSIIHVVFQIILLIGLILSKFWKINVISPLMFIALIRIYFSLFQKNKILESSEDPLTMFFNMICWL